MIPEAVRVRTLRSTGLKGLMEELQLSSKELSPSGLCFEADSMATILTYKGPEWVGSGGARRKKCGSDLERDLTCVARWLKAKEKPHRDVWQGGLKSQLMEDSENVPSEWKGSLAISWWSSSQDFTLLLQGHRFSASLRAKIPQTVLMVCPKKGKKDHLQCEGSRTGACSSIMD